MRKIDKLRNLEKINILVEQRYLNEKFNIINEDYSDNNNNNNNNNELTVNEFKTKMWDFLEPYLTDGQSIVYMMTRIKEFINKFEYFYFERNKTIYRDPTGKMVNIILPYINDPNQVKNFIALIKEYLETMKSDYNRHNRDKIYNY